MTSSTPKIGSLGTFLGLEGEEFNANTSLRKTFPLKDSRRYCRWLAKSHYENFSVASFLVPRSLRQDFYNVYAFCRWSDDLADESGDRETARQRLAWWQTELDRCFAGEASHPVFVALRETIRQRDLERKPFDDLLSAFRQDQSKTRYCDDLELHDYCRRSADPVGRILLRLADVDDSISIAMSDSICTALQCINFAQDVSRDAAIERIYLPTARYATYEVDEAMIMARRATPQLCQAVLDWAVEIRDAFYDHWELTNRVPSWLGRDIRLFASGGICISNRIIAAKGDVWSARCTVSKFDKLAMLFRVLITSTPIPRTPAIGVSSRSRVNHSR